jgi:hypothetical protein
MIDRRRRLLRPVALGLTVVCAGLAGCDRDEDDRGAYTTAAPTKEEFCAAMAKVDAPFTEAGQYATREQKVEAAKKVTDLLNDAAKAAPPDIADAANTKLAAIRTTAEGEPSKLLDSATLDATAKIKAYCPA